MDISLREWLIIGGVLIVILILVDGWRRVSANRSRLRLEIDRTLSELDENDPHNPELPNGGARVRDQGSRPQGEAARVEPGFAEDRFASPPAQQTLAEMDPLFDDIPSTVQKERGSASPVLARESVAETPVRKPRVDEAPPELVVPSDPVSPELRQLDLERPIPVLFDEVNPSDNRELPDDTLAAYRQAVDATEEQKPVPDEPQPEPEPEPECVPEPVLEPEPEPEFEFEPEQSRVQDPEVSVTEQAEPAGAAEELDSSSEMPPQTFASAQETTAAEGDATAAPAVRGLKTTPDPEHVLIITVVGRNGQYLPGPVLNRIVTACGMEWGDMAIYHRPEDSRPDAPIQFSMANAVAPGTFDPNNLEALETPAVTFFMSLDEPTEAMTAYECMLATAETLAKHLDGDLLDEDRSVMRPQTKEHYRERIRDFEMHKRQRRAN